MVIYSTITKERHQFVVGEFENGKIAFDACKRLASIKNWEEGTYKSNFENIEEDEEEVLSLK